MVAIEMLKEKKSMFYRDGGGGRGFFDGIKRIEDGWSLNTMLALRFIWRTNSTELREERKLSSEQSDDLHSYPHPLRANQVVVHLYM